MPVTYRSGSLAAGEKVIASYYVNNQAQSNGDHEVHVWGCSYFPANRMYLGEFSSCGPAVQEAKRYYTKANGCYFCSRSCHTS